MNHAKSETEPKGGGYFLTTTTTTTTLAPEPVEANSDAISPNGLNIQRIKHSPTPKYNEKNEKKTFHTNPPPPPPPPPPPSRHHHPVDVTPDTTEFVDEEPEIRRSSERRPSQFRRPPQREYDDYQYFESDRDYLGPEYYPRSNRIPYYSQSRIPTRSPHEKRIPSYEGHRPIPYNGNEYIDRHFYPPPSQPRPLPVAIPTLSPNPLPASPPPRQHPLHPQIPQRPHPNPPQLHSPPPPTSSPKKNLQMTPENCQKVKSFASNFGVKNPQTWVRQNCLFAQTFVPNTSCEDLATFVDSCYRHHFL
uniref:Uncharacterized protein n=1 Tax=Panagrolaimus sp. ES5 TaxID=591445 RepID=A0AC34GP09_9BILA